jgi:hypothetical protein
VPTHSKKNPFPAVLLVICLCAFLLTLALSLNAQDSSQPSPGTPPGLKLAPYTAPDKSVSAGVPPGWNVTKGAETVVQMSGPNGETIFLGNTVIVRDAPFQLGEHGTGGVDLSMPNSASLDQKFVMIVEDNAAFSNGPKPQVSFTTVTNMHLPFAFGECGRLAGNAMEAKGPITFTALICSLPLDAGGTYKVMLKLAQAPAAGPPLDKAFVSAVFSSYDVPADLLQRKLAPLMAAPPSRAPETPVVGPTVTPVTSPGCFDLAVLREVPADKLPKECGGPGPN